MDHVSLFLQIYGLSHKILILDVLMIFGAQYLIFVTFLLIAVLFFFGKKEERKAIFFIFFGYIISQIIIFVIHHFYFEPRPFITLPIAPLIQHAADAAFPSRHTTIMSVIAFGFTFCKSKYTLLFILLMLFVGFSRIFVGVHYPLDILGGIITGLISIILAKLLVKLLQQTLH